MTVLESQITSDMRAAPEAVRRQDKVLAAALPALAERLRRKPPQVVVTCARGSSAHAATFGNQAAAARRSENSGSNIHFGIF